ncbi:hypothetical protein TNCV_2628531 [Trichonephila clavipes]|uniref:Uncharacterized protein n=1 Tax=Trichonephila clavipes TaxID=2585209 RepID=A0A8X6VEZ4_TRICX|nr:hypothetical protein TNCV_2628531 [Trichonephila clavipes]
MGGVAIYRVRSPTCLRLWQLSILPSGTRQQLKSNTKAIYDGSLNFESRSSDQDDTRAGSSFSPNYHTNGRTLRLVRFNVHLLSLHDGSSVSLGLETVTLRPQVCNQPLGYYGLMRVVVTIIK